MIIGIIGKTGTGKNYISQYFEKKGFAHIDLDKLGHEALGLSTDLLKKAFGEEVLTEDGLVDRKKLGDIVFVNKEKLKELEQITYPIIDQLLEQSLSDESQNYVINGVKLLEMDTDFSCDIYLEIKAPLIVRFYRLIKRKDADLRKIVKRIYAQRQINYNFFTKTADIVRVNNYGNNCKLQKKLDKLCKRLGLNEK